jgi:hypothetical protein
MTDRLREWLDEAGKADWLEALHALRAVVELHKTVERPLHAWDICDACQTGPTPCPTIKAIEREVFK